MAKFIYKLQNILDLKERFEENERNNYAEKRRLLTDEEDRLKGLQAQKKELEAEGRRLRNDKLDVREIMANTRAKEIMDENIKKQRLKVRVAEKNLEAARLRMQEAMKERKIHDKLKENAFEEFIAEENSREIKEIDELTSYVYGTKTEE